MAKEVTQRKFAAFDIDGTIGRNSIFIAVTEELVRAGHLPVEAGLEVEKKHEAYKRRAYKEVFNEYTEASVNALFAHMKKLKVKDYQEAVDRIMEKHKLYTYVYTRDLIKKLKSEGYFLIALSGSEMYGVQQFCEYYGFDVAVGETYEEKNGFFSGKIQGVMDGKGVILKRLIKEHDLTLKDSIAIGDSKSDAKMLELVEHPIAFNPENRLYDIAVKNKWKIVVERKNVIYKLEPGKSGYVLKAE